MKSGRRGKDEGRKMEREDDDVEAVGTVTNRRRGKRVECRWIVTVSLLNSSRRSLASRSPLAPLRAAAPTRSRACCVRGLPLT